jgi:replicative superfamily II helicase
MNIKTIVKGNNLKIENDKGLVQSYELRRGQKDIIDLTENNFMENLLFVAPTAYGKTIGAVNYIIKVYNSGMKSIYCAPLKALTAEIEIELNNLGFNVIQDTGDNRKNPEKDYPKCDVLITTYERFDSVIRNPRNHDLIEELFGLIIVDEVHSVYSDSRGVNLESLIVKVKYHTSMAIMGLSATADNIGDVANFLEAKYVYVPKEERPVKQTVNIKYYYGDYQSVAMKEKNIWLRKTFNDIILQDGQALIFCSSRRRCEILAKEFGGYNINDPIKLALKSNYSWHHAGLQHFQKKEIETLFLKEKLRFIFCTPTLAMGVNLPAYSVIIYDSTRWNGLLSDEVLIDNIEIQQMVGRAGRPQFGQTECDVYVYVHQKYNPYTIEESIIESKMLKQMKSVLNEWINSSITMKDEIKICLNQTLLSQQIDRDEIKNHASEALTWLVNNGFCHFLGDQFTSTFLGKMTALFYIQPETALHFKKIETTYHEKDYTDLELTAKLINTEEFLENIRVEERDAELIRICSTEFIENRIDLKLFDERILKSIPLIFKTHFENKYNVRIMIYRNDAVALNKLMERIFTSAGVIIFNKVLKSRVNDLKVMVQNKTLDRSLAVLRGTKGIGDIRLNRLIHAGIKNPEQFLKLSDVKLMRIMRIKINTLDTIKHNLKERLRE